jgi:hypothetical protein
VVTCIFLLKKRTPSRADALRLARAACRRKCTL